MNEKSTPRITGGRAGFIAAANAAFKANICNPTVRYSTTRGFHVESGLIPADDDVVWHREAYLDLSHNYSRSLRPRDYATVRKEIIYHLSLRAAQILEAAEFN